MFTLFNYLDSNTHKFVCYYGINTIPYKFALLSSHVPNDKLLPVTGCSTIYSCITTKADHLSECHQIVFIFPSRLPDGTSLSMCAFQGSWQALLWFEQEDKNEML